MKQKKIKQNKKYIQKDGKKNFVYNFLFINFVLILF